MYNNITATPRKLAQLLKEVCQRKGPDCIGCDLGNKFCVEHFEFYPEHWIFEDKEEGPRVETKEDDMVEVKTDEESFLKIIEKSDIKRCPFCGGMAKLNEVRYILSRNVECTVCGAQGKEYEYTAGDEDSKRNAEELAVSAWNLRK